MSLGEIHSKLEEAKKDPVVPNSLSKTVASPSKVADSLHSAVQARKLPPRTEEIREKFVPLEPKTAAVGEKTTIAENQQATKGLGTGNTGNQATCHAAGMKESKGMISEEKDLKQVQPIQNSNLETKDASKINFSTEFSNSILTAKLAEQGGKSASTHPENDQMPKDAGGQKAITNNQKAEEPKVGVPRPNPFFLQQKSETQSSSHDQGKSLNQQEDITERGKKIGSSIMDKKPTKRDPFFENVVFKVEKKEEKPEESKPDNTLLNLFKTSFNLESNKLGQNEKTSMNSPSDMGGVQAAKPSSNFFNKPIINQPKENLASSSITSTGSTFFGKGVQPPDQIANTTVIAAPAKRSSFFGQHGQPSQPQVSSSSIFDQQRKASPQKGGEIKQGSFFNKAKDSIDPSPGTGFRFGQEPISNFDISVLLNRSGIERENKMPEPRPVQSSTSFFHSDQPASSSGFFGGANREKKIEEEVSMGVGPSFGGHVRTGASQTSFLNPSKLS